MRAENQRLCIGLGFFRTFAVAVPHPPQAVPPPPGGGYKGCGSNLKQLDKLEFEEVTNRARSGCVPIATALCTKEKFCFGVALPGDLCYNVFNYI